jgi:hypothetical protein
VFWTILLVLKKIQFSNVLFVVVYCDSLMTLIQFIRFFHFCTLFPVLHSVIADICKHTVNLHLNVVFVIIIIIMYVCNGPLFWWFCHVFCCITVVKFLNCYLTGAFTSFVSFILLDIQSLSFITVFCCTGKL